MNVQYTVAQQQALFVEILRERLREIAKLKNIFFNLIIPSQH